MDETDTRLIENLLRRTQLSARPGGGFNSARVIGILRRTLIAAAPEPCA
jgi:hypothetical protein